MSPEEFRRHGHAVIDWIADYLADPEKWPVLPSVKPGQLRNSLPPSPPEHGESMDDILADFQQLIVPANTHWNHPDFMAYFPNSATGAGVLGEALSAALNVNAMLWRTTPAGTELETHTLDWLRQMMGLEEGWFGIIGDTASAYLYSLAARDYIPSCASARNVGKGGSSEAHVLLLRGSPLQCRQGGDDAGIRTRIAAQNSDGFVIENGHALAARRHRE
jgi:aromatic-L-amino-acid decarboxylase